MTTNDSRTLLIRAASDLFRQKGYGGSGLSEILARAELPKGSLYYHFPGGKRQLAEAATLWAGDSVARVFDKAFDGAADFRSGAVELCEALASTMVRDGRVEACPVLSILQAGAEEPELRAMAQEIYDSWRKRLVAHAARLNEADPEGAAGSLFLRLNGAWLLSFASQSDAAFRALGVELRGAEGSVQNPVRG